jgi:hypothetical protein
MNATHADDDTTPRYDVGRDVVMNAENDPGMLPTFVATITAQTHEICIDHGCPMYKVFWHQCGRDYEGVFCEDVMEPVQ